MHGLTALLLFTWFMAVVGGAHARTSGLIHIALVVAAVMYSIGGV